MSFGPRGGEVPGVVVGDRILPLGALAAELGLPPHAAPRELLPVLDRVAERLESAVERFGDDLVPLAGARLGPPVVDPPNIFVCGANYHAHLREVGRFDDESKLPTLPVVVFQKPLSALSGPYDPIVRPPETECLDYEAELAVVIGKGGRRISAQDAPGHIAGYMISNDVSTRDLGVGESRKLNSAALIQLMRAKGWDTFLPTGPWLVTADEAGPFGAIRLQLSVNGEPRQDGFASEMHRSPFELIEWLSATTTLRPGDIITTGTPTGVAAGMKPPKWLAPGDVVRIEMTGLSVMETPVAGEAI
ncbi:fumarylacetoacetate hydrolase family protein [Dactylosporangium sp. CA-092794]|uniref:fumarylacetoacetate hydrolase family protein n=1 Tax=Dactylosporangium sp. CA-092794 TaxID=3239929 RepID=UPI003D9157D8